MIYCPMWGCTFMRQVVWYDWLMGTTMYHCLSIFKYIGEEVFQRQEMEFFVERYGNILVGRRLLLLNIMPEFNCHQENTNHKMGGYPSYLEEG